MSKPCIVVFARAPLRYDVSEGARVAGDGGVVCDATHTSLLGAGAGTNTSSQDLYNEQA